MQTTNPNFNAWAWNDPRLTISRRAAMYSLALFYSQDQDKPDYKNSDKNDVCQTRLRGAQRNAPLVYRINHQFSWDCLIRLLNRSDSKLKGSAPLKCGHWVHAIIYENIGFNAVYERYPGNVVFQLKPEIITLETGGKLLNGWRNLETDQVTPVDLNIVKSKCQYTWAHWKEYWMPKVEKEKFKKEGVAA